MLLAELLENHRISPGAGRKTVPLRTGRNVEESLPVCMVVIIAVEEPVVVWRSVLVLGIDVATLVETVMVEVPTVE